MRANRAFFFFSPRIGNVSFLPLTLGDNKLSAAKLRDRNFGSSKNVSEGKLGNSDVAELVYRTMFRGVIGICRPICDRCSKSCDDHHVLFRIGLGNENRMSCLGRKLF